MYMTTLGISGRQTPFEMTEVLLSPFVMQGFTGISCEPQECQLGDAGTKPYLVLDFLSRRIR